MKTVQSIAEEIVAREGGYVNDPDDHGGATNFGVTIGTMKRLGLDSNGDGRVTTADVKNLTRGDAVRIFMQHYYVGPGIDQLPEVLQASVFDMQVNAGNNAVKILQRVLRHFGQTPTVDGSIGPQTQVAAAEAFAVAPHHLADAYAIARRNYYYALADARTASRKYARRRNGGKGGWIKRAEDFMSVKYHYDRAEHEIRTAKWA